jgi:CRISPR-associated protein Csm5
MSNNTVPITVQTLTPVHIGSGDELRGNFEYLIFSQEGQIAVIDPSRIFDIIGEENLSQWTTIVEKEESLLDYIVRRKPDVQAADVAQRIISIFGKAPQTRNSIKEQLHLADSNPTIPGSSLKGSIRTAILSKLIKDDPSFVQREDNLGSRKRDYLQYHSRQVEAHYLGKEGTPNRFGELQQSPNRDLLRFLRIGDGYFTGTSTCVVRNTIINLFRHGWGEKREESSFYECIPADAKTSAALQVPDELIKRVIEKHYIAPGKFDLLSAKRLFKLINEHTSTLLQGEISFWEDEDNPLAIGDYLDRLIEIQEQIKNLGEDACILRVGAGSGWEFMTGGWLTGKDRMGDFILSDDAWKTLKRELRRRRNYADDVIFPKTRKMVDGGEPLGFVKLEMKN